jgi:hypothetical protein
MAKKLRSCLPYILGAIVFLSGYFTSYVLEDAFYIKLPIDLPTASAPHGNWSATEHTVQTWPNDGYRYYILRKVGSVSDSCCDDPYSLDELICYFDTLLTTQGWRRASVAQICDGQLSEMEFLPPSDYAAYFKQGDSSSLQPFLCLAIWSDVYEDKVYGHNVILLTANPSLYTRFLSVWE